MNSQTIVLIAVLLDQMLGEMSRWHPLVGFGNLAQLVEHRLIGAETPAEPQIITRLKGCLAVLTTCLPFVFIASRLTSNHYFGPIVDIGILYLAIGARSLRSHAISVAKVLDQGDLAGARARVALMVSRETAQMEETDVRKAAIESVLENGNDAIFATLFWYLVGGAPGAVLYRLVNTLDAMWGYKTERYLHFGWAAARFDDLLNWIPARLTAVTYMTVGSWFVGWQCWQKQARSWYSPNAGPVLAAGAGALNLRLGGPAMYHGQLKERPILGDGKVPERGDIERAVDLVQKGLCIWVAISFAGLIFHA